MSPEIKLLPLPECFSSRRFADYSMYSTFLTASPGSVLFSRSALLKRKDLCFSCLRLAITRHRRSKKPHTFFSKSSPRFSRGDPSATASTSCSCAGKRCVLIETRSYTGPCQTTRRRASWTPVSSRNGSCFSWLSSTYRRRQELNGLATLYFEVAPLLRMLFLVAWGLWKSLASALFTSTLRYDRPQKLSSSSATFCHASCLWKNHPFGKLSKMLRPRLSI
jgi:hypothetical protein